MIARNKRIISRLSRYKSTLTRLKSLGFVRIISEYLADVVGVTSSQVRKDFSLFGITGNKRGGYNIDVLLEKLGSILGKDSVQLVVLAGAGNLGRALLNYRGFEQEGIRIAAAFDIDPAKLNPCAPVPVLPMAGLAEWVCEHDIHVGIIAVPHMVAQEVLATMITAGIRGVLNFAPLQLRAPDDCIVNNVNVELELENIIYFVNAARRASEASP